jgi:siderophore synthetase component
MDRGRVEALLARYRLKLAADTWDHMPASSVGENRLIHSLFFGHLAVAVDFLSEKFAVSQPELMHILSEEWANLREAVRRVKGAATRFDSLCEHLAKGKLMLVARLERSHQMRFVRLPKHAAFLRLQGLMPSSGVSRH